jgi:DNA-binding NtrC family response regulator
MKPLKVLIVEDEAMISMLIEDAVEEAGHEVAATAANVADAMEAAGSGEFDVALIDVNLNGQRAHALPVKLTARGKPFAFMTGYGSAGVPDQFPEAPVIGKPFTDRQVVDVLALLAARAAKD